MLEYRAPAGAPLRYAPATRQVASSIHPEYGCKMAELPREMAQSVGKMAELLCQMVKLVRAFQALPLGGFVDGSDGWQVVYDEFAVGVAFSQEEPA